MFVTIPDPGAATPTTTRWWRAALLRGRAISRTTSQPRRLRLAWVSAIALCLWALGASRAGADRPDLGADWNDGTVAWRSFSAGLAEAEHTGRPICLVVHTTWCSDCKLYSAVFHDARVVEQSKRFVMIRVDQEREPEVADRFAPDGRYIPRTFFLRQGGELLTSIRSSRGEAVYNYPEDDPGALLRAMAAALDAAKQAPAHHVPESSSTQDRSGGSLAGAGAGGGISSKRSSAS